jgi:hypothetical protein
MFTRSLHNRLFASSLSALTLLVIIPFSLGGTSAALPIGQTTSSGVVSIAGSTAPSGTVVFSGERVMAQEAPALISFRQGGSVLLNEGAGATFSRNGDVLLIQASNGTMSFNLPAGEKVRIQAGSHNYVSSESGSVGEITMVPEGAPSVLVASGNLYALNAAASVAAAQDQPKGNLTKGSNSFTDPNAKWKPDQYKNYGLLINGKQFTVVSNTEKTIKIKETFSLNTGTYSYSIGGLKHAGMSKNTKIVIGVAVAGGGAGAAIAAAKAGGSKSPS